MLTATQRDQVWEHRQRQQEERQAQFKYRLERAWNESTTQVSVHCYIIICDGAAYVF